MEFPAQAELDKADREVERAELNEQLARERYEKNPGEDAYTALDMAIRLAAGARLKRGRLAKRFECDVDESAGQDDAAAFYAGKKFDRENDPRID